MQIWHFLSKDRLLQKIEFANLNEGALLLHPSEPSKDISKGQLANYIYCLPSILSGMKFSDEGPIEVIKVFLKESTRIFKFEGNPRNLDYANLKNSYDVIDMTVSSPDFSEIRFRQILLMNSSVVEKWEHSLETNFLHDFNIAWEKVQRNDFSPSDFFMIDFNSSEIQSAARINSMAMGLKVFSDEILKSDEQTIMNGLKRLGALA
jgi:hypothetical protein